MTPGPMANGSDTATADAPGTSEPPYDRPRCVMFVLNDVTQDRRVQKEAATLVSTGFDVTVIGLLPAKGRVVPEHEFHPAGFEIRRLPLPKRPAWRPPVAVLQKLRTRVKKKVNTFMYRLGRQYRINRNRFRRLRHRVRLNWLSARKSAGRGWNGGRRGPNPGRRLSRFVPVGRARQLAGLRHVHGLPVTLLRVVAHPRRSRAALGRALTRALAWRSGRARATGEARAGARRVAAGGGDAGPALNVLPVLRGLARAGSAVLRVAFRTTSAFVSAVGSLAGFAVYAVWAVLYVATMTATRWQLEWLLNVRERWLGWARSAAMEAGPATVYHGHDLSAVGAAVYAQQMFGGGLVYDSHEVYLEAGSNGTRPRWPRWILSRLERRWFRRADAIVTVNQLVAQELVRRYGVKERMAVVHNCPATWAPPEPRPDLLRTAAGIPPGAPILLYHGGLTAVRGLAQLAEAMLEPGLEEAHLCYLGFGPMRDELLALAAEPRFGGRIHLLDGVPPDELDLWVASADIGMMPNQPETLNELVSTPNKLFESIAAGVPVVTSDFPERRRIVIDDPDGPLGAVCDPVSPRSIAEATRSILELGERGRSDYRARCLKAANERWNWERESERLTSLYAALLREGPRVDAGRRDHMGLRRRRGYERAEHERRPLEPGGARPATARTRAKPYRAVDLARRMGHSEGPHVRRRLQSTAGPDVDRHDAPRSV